MVVLFFFVFPVLIGLYPSQRFGAECEWAAHFRSQILTRVPFPRPHDTSRSASDFATLHNACPWKHVLRMVTPIRLLGLARSLPEAAQAVDNYSGGKV